MSAFDVTAVLRGLRGFGLVESPSGCVHLIARPGTVTDVVLEGVDQFSWAPRALCGQTPRPSWVSIAHLGDRNQGCKHCHAKWRRLCWTFSRLDPEGHPAGFHLRPPNERKR